MRTTAKTESLIPRISKILHFTDEPKWMTIRFAIFISLSIEENIDYTEKIDFNGGKTYNLEVITGKGKTDIIGIHADITDLTALYLANFDQTKIKNEKELEKILEHHCERGFQILASSLNENSNIFEWLKEEFSI